MIDVNHEEEYVSIVKELAEISFQKDFGGYPDKDVLHKLTTLLGRLEKTSDHSPDVCEYCGRLEDDYKSILSVRKFERFGGVDKLRMNIRSDIGRLERWLNMARDARKRNGP